MATQTSQSRSQTALRTGVDAKAVVSIPTAQQVSVAASLDHVTRFCCCYICFSCKLPCLHAILSHFLASRLAMYDCKCNLKPKPCARCRSSNNIQKGKRSLAAHLALARRATVSRDSAETRLTTSWLLALKEASLLPLKASLQSLSRTLYSRTRASQLTNSLLAQLLSM